eukprot:GHVP01031303.1.p1 GENE.GHVP01031303.1~~GHVP01031303.1.p1  ORF type:complete len:416 (+),score=71.60 GHVP01031303.1:669-1916(+)
MKSQKETRNRSWASQSTDVPNGRYGNLASFDTSPYSGPSGMGQYGGSSTMTLTKTQTETEEEEINTERLQHQTTNEYHHNTHPPIPQFHSQESNISNISNISNTSNTSNISRSAHRYSNINPPYDYSQYHSEMSGRILGSQTIEREIKVPRKIVVEEQIERIVVVPETVKREQIIEETVRVKQRVVEVAKPVKRERIVEVPEIVYVDKKVEYIENITQEKIVEVPRFEIRENIVHVPKIVHSEKIVEYPVYEYREVPFEKVVEVPEIREEVMIKEVTVPRYVDVPFPEYKDVEVTKDIERKVPVPFETVITENYEVPQIRAEYERVPVPIYAPRFVEVPVPIEQLNEEGAETAAELVSHVTAVCTHPYPSLCEIENVAEKARNFSPEIESDPSIMENGWNNVLSSSNQTTKPRKN